jgi:hypothetical protein
MFFSIFFTVDFARLDSILTALKTAAPEAAALPMCSVQEEMS